MEQLSSFSCRICPTAVSLSIWSRQSFRNDNVYGWLGLSTTATWLSGVISTLRPTLNFHNVWFNLTVVGNMDDYVRCNTSNQLVLHFLATCSTRKIAEGRLFSRHLFG